MRKIPGVGGRQGVLLLYLPVKKAALVASGLVHGGDRWGAGARPAIRPAGVQPSPACQQRLSAGSCRLPAAPGCASVLTRGVQIVLLAGFVHGDALEHQPLAEPGLLQTEGRGSRGSSR